MSGYSFESFVVCDRSRVAFSAAAAVTEGRHRGALFLAGPTGSGKTHLLHAISRAIRSRRPDAQILHVPAATLASRVVEAIRVDDLHAFRQSLDKLDALLLDDLYLRPFMLEEILRIAENLSRQGIAVVAAADAAPPRWPGAVVAIGWPGKAHE